MNLDEEVACIKIHNHHVDGTPMRPGRTSPDYHWSSRLINEYLGRPGITTAASKEGPEVWIYKNFWQEDSDGERAFQHIMRFIKINKLAYTVELTQCTDCPGHEDCVSAKPDGFEWKIKRFSEE